MSYRVICPTIRSPIVACSFSHLLITFDYIYKSVYKCHFSDQIRSPMMPVTFTIYNLQWAQWSHKKKILVRPLQLSSSSWWSPIYSGPCYIVSCSYKCWRGYQWWSWYIWSWFITMIIFIADFGQDHNNNGMVNGFCLCTIVYNGFSKVANHWTSDGIVMMFFQ